MDWLKKIDSAKTSSNLVLAIGIGREGAISLEYLKKMGLGKIDFMIPDHNLTSRDLAPYKLIFLMSGTGDQPTAEVAHSIADITKGADGSTIGIVALPFLAEGAQSTYPFSAEMESFKKLVDLLIIISNDDLLRPDIGNSCIDLHNIAHNQIWLAVKTMTDLITFTGVVCVDSTDLQIVAKNSGYGFFTSGQASGANRVLKAVRMAIPAASMISNQVSLAKNLLLYIYYGPDEITIGEIGEILDILQKTLNPQCEILWNCGYDPILQDDLKISIIWTVLEKPPVFDHG